jgi:hypothetical protein
VSKAAARERVSFPFSWQRELKLGQSRAAQISLVLACFAFLRWRIRVALAQSPFRGGM